VTTPTVNARPSLAGRDASIVRLTGAEIRDVLGLRLDPRGGVNVGQIVGQHGIERGPVAPPHRFEAAVVSLQNIDLGSGRLGTHRRQTSREDGVILTRVTTLRGARHQHDPSGHSC